MGRNKIANEWTVRVRNKKIIPQSPVELNDTDGEKLANLIEALEENEDVQDVFTTADSLEEQ